MPENRSATTTRKSVKDQEPGDQEPVDQEQKKDQGPKLVTKYVTVRHVDDLSLNTAHYTAEAARDMALSTGVSPETLRVVQVQCIETDTDA